MKWANITILPPPALPAPAGLPSWTHLGVSRSALGFTSSLDHNNLKRPRTPPDYPDCGWSLNVSLMNCQYWSSIKVNSQSTSFSPIGNAISRRLLILYRYR